MVCLQSVVYTTSPTFLHFAIQTSSSTTQSTLCRGVNLISIYLCYLPVFVCHILCLFLHIIGLFGHIVGLSSHVSRPYDSLISNCDLFRHIIRLFCHIIGLFCHVSWPCERLSYGQFYCSNHDLYCSNSAYI